VHSGQVEVFADPVSGFDDTTWLERVALNAAIAALDAEHTQGPDAVTVLLSDDTRVRNLNREFNGEDSITDVLSFNETPGWHNGVPPAESPGAEFFLGPGSEPRLGDIVISLPQVRKQAEEHGVLVEKELAMLVIHGVLHLLGYDHAGAEEERVMFGKTERILENVSV
jgi:probable rRNA maturation factor